MHAYLLAVALWLTSDWKVRRSSLRKDIDEANGWKQKILKHAAPITSLDDLRSRLVE